MTFNPNYQQCTGSWEIRPETKENTQKKNNRPKKEQHVGNKGKSGNNSMANDPPHVK